MSKREIKIPYAERDGELVHVSAVDRGLDCGCICPVCKEPVVARKGEVKRHHFAHYAGGMCDPEGVLHFMGKELLRHRISRNIRHERPLRMQWQCCYCGDVHGGNLLKMAESVELEHAFYGCRPDMTLFDCDGVPVSFIEVIVTHAPEDHVREYCDNHGVTLVQFHISNGRDLLALEHEQPLRPDLVDLCLRPQCPECAEVLVEADLYVIEIPCWRCGLTMPAAVVRAGGHLFGPEKFSDDQVQIAEQHGALLQTKYSLTSHRRYLTNTCPSCGAFTGASYLRQYGSRAEGQGGEPIGPICPNCDRRNEEG